MMKKCSSIIACLDKKKTLFIKNNYVVKECETCGHRFCDIVNFIDHVAKVYSDSYFFEGKDGYPNYLEERDVLVRRGTHYANISSSYIAPPGSVLDVGCAAGFILKGFQMKGWECKGLEPNITMVDYGRKELNLNIMQGDLETTKIDGKFDLILMVEVIGHFHDLDKAMQHAKDLLKPRGFVLIESWNMNSLIARILGKRWEEYSPPSVVHWFSRKTLIDFMSYYKFGLIDVGFPLKLLNVKHAISLLDNKTINFPLKRAIFQGITKHFGWMKMYYPPVDLNWYIFQSNEQ